MPATGLERLLDVAWSDEEFGDECVEPEDVTATGWSGSLHVQVRLTGLAEGEDFRLVVTRPDGTVGTSLQGAWSDQPCLRLWMVPIFEGEPLDPGTYTVTALAGPTWDEVGQAATEIAEPAGD